MLFIVNWYLFNVLKKISQLWGSKFSTKHKELLSMAHVDTNKPLVTKTGLNLTKSGMFFWKHEVLIAVFAYFLRGMWKRILIIFLRLQMWGTR